MSETRVHLEERQAHGERCAYCHGALDGEVARCERCHVELHADCRAELGKCPTLGCTARSQASVPLPVHAPLPVHGPPRIHPRPDLNISPPRRPPRVTVWPRPLALAELYLSTGFVMLLASLFSVVGTGGAGLVVWNASSLAESFRHGRRGEIHTPLLGWLSLFMTLVFIVVVTYVVGHAAWNMLRSLFAVPALLRDAPVERTLEVRSVGHGKGQHLEYFLEGSAGTRHAPSWVPIDASYVVSLGWGRVGRSQVKVHGFGVPGDVLLLESERGRLALVFRAGLDMRRRAS